MANVINSGINSIEDDALGFTVPLSSQAHQQAQALAEQQPEASQARQTYLNTLAVLAMQQYFSCLGLDSDSRIGAPQDPVMGLLSQGAELRLQGIGSLECRPVLSSEQVCNVPPETWNDRVGYVAVRLSDDLRTAYPLGFLPQVSQADIPLNQWQALELMLEQLQPELQPVPQPASSTASLVKTSTELISDLSQWLTGHLDTGWETVEEIFGLQHPQLSFRMRGGYTKRAKRLHLISETQPSGESSKSGSRLPDSAISDLAASDSAASDSAASDSAASVHLSSPSSPPGLSPSVALLVGIKAVESAARETYEILVKLLTTEPEQLLPPGLIVNIFDQNEQSVMYAEARDTSEIQLEFRGKRSECFSLKVSLGAVEYVEAFQI